ncbi:MAG: hypothetical protein WC222_05360 [Parachlamydiales bacterium]|jgi:hypothetical protein
MNMQLSPDQYNAFFGEIIEKGVNKKFGTQTTFDELLSNPQYLKNEEVYSVALEVFNKAMALPDSDEKMEMLVRAHEILTSKSSNIASVISSFLTYIPGTQNNTENNAMISTESYFHSHFKDFILARSHVHEKMDMFQRNFTANYDRIDRCMNELGVDPQQWNDLKVALEKNNQSDSMHHWDNILTNIRGKFPGFKSNGDVQKFLFNQLSIGAAVKAQSNTEARFLALFPSFPKDVHLLEQEISLLKGRGLVKLDDFIDSQAKRIEVPFNPKEFTSKSLTEISPHEFKKLQQFLEDVPPSHEQKYIDFLRTNNIDEQDLNALSHFEKDYRTYFTRFPPKEIQTTEQTNSLREFFFPPKTSYSLDELILAEENKRSFNNTLDEFEESQVEREGGVNTENRHQPIVQNPFDEEVPITSTSKITRPSSFNSQHLEEHLPNIINNEKLSPQQKGHIYSIALENQNYLCGNSPETPSQTISYFKRLDQESVETIVQLSKPSFIPSSVDKPIQLGAKSSVRLVVGNTQPVNKTDILMNRSIIEVKTENSVKRYEVLSLQDNGNVKSFFDPEMMPEFTIAEDDDWDFIQENDISLSEKPSVFNPVLEADDPWNPEGKALTIEDTSPKSQNKATPSLTFIGSYGQLSVQRLAILSAEIKKSEDQGKRCIVNDTPDQENSSALVIFHHLNENSKKELKAEGTIREYQQFAPVLRDKDYLKTVVLKALENRNQPPK